jgi:hypothetical protein
LARLESSPRDAGKLKEEFRSIATYPHHHHDAQGNVQPSPLLGDPVSDIQMVLAAVSQFMATHN